MSPLMLRVRVLRFRRKGGYKGNMFFVSSYKGPGHELNAIMGSLGAFRPLIDIVHE